MQKSCHSVPHSDPRPVSGLNFPGMQSRQPAADFWAMAVPIFPEAHLVQYDASLAPDDGLKVPLGQCLHESESSDVCPVWAPYLPDPHALHAG